MAYGGRPAPTTGPPELQEAKLSQITLEDVQVLHRLQVRRKLSLGALMACALPLVLLVGPSWDSASLLASLCAELGLALIGICILGRVWCALYIGGKKSVELVQAGPYSVSRNPLYLFSCLGALGVGLRTQSLSLAAFFLLAAVLVALPVIRVEELVMRRTFGAAFHEYCRRVPRFGPRLALWRDAPLLALEPRHLYRVLGDSLLFAGTVPLLALIAWLQAEQVLPVLLRLP